MTHGGAISKRSATRYKTPQNLRKYETDFSVLLSKISAVLAALHFQKYTILWVGVTPWFAQRSNNGKMKLVTSPPDQKLGEITHIKSEEHTSELQSLMRISYAVFCLKKKNKKNKRKTDK